MMTTLFRVDASPSMGTGHLMRCLALAQALHSESMATAFLSASLPEGLRDRLKQEKCSVHELTSSPYGEDDIRETTAVAKDIDAQWIIIDGYTFGAAYQQALKQHNLTVLFIDDYGHAKEYAADIVLNQNVYADEKFYAKRMPDTTLLLGTRYALLRREFALGGLKRDSATVAKIIVTLGGADPDNVTGKVIEALQGLKDISVKVVVGSANPNLKAIEAVCKETSAAMIVDAPNMKDLMEWADLAISGGGTTCYEVACVGLPSLTIVLADNQRAVAEGMERAGVSINLGRHADVSPDAIANAVLSLTKDVKKRAAMSDAGRRIVDGHGAARVCMHMLGEKLWLRPVQFNDCDVIFERANDPEARSASFSPETIPWENHVQWFHTKLADPAHAFFIALDAADQPVGQVRFERDDGNATISVSIDPKHRGKGYGKALIMQGCRRLFGTTTTEQIDAFIKPDNGASIAAFQKAGFREVGPTEIKGQSALNYALKRNTIET